MKKKIVIGMSLAFIIASTMTSWIETKEAEQVTLEAQNKVIVFDALHELVMQNEQDKQEILATINEIPIYLNEVYLYAGLNVLHLENYTDYEISTLVDDESLLLSGFLDIVNYIFCDLWAKANNEDLSVASNQSVVAFEDTLEHQLKGSTSGLMATYELINKYEDDFLTWKLGRYGQIAMDQYLNQYASIETIFSVQKQLRQDYQVTLTEVVGNYMDEASLEEVLLEIGFNVGK